MQVRIQVAIHSGCVDDVNVCVTDHCVLTLSQLPGRPVQRSHSPAPSLSVEAESWGLLVRPESKAMCVFARELQAQSCAGWERGQSGSRSCSSRQNRPYHCHHLSCCTGRNSHTGCKVTLYSSLSPCLGPGTAVVQVAVVSTGNRAEFFSRKLVCVESSILIMLTNICSSGLCHVSNPVMSCKEKKSLICSKEQLFPL